MRIALVLCSMVPAMALAQTPIAPTSRVAPVKAAGATGDDRMICKTFAVTGSLVRTTRVCKEKHYWDMEYALRRQSVTTSSCGVEGGVCPSNDAFGAMGTGQP